MEEQPTLDEIINFAALSENLGSAGQPTREQYPAISAAGYQAVVNLARPESEGAFPEEGDRVRSLGLQYFPLPVLWEQPTLADLDAFFEVMNSLRGRKVFVHCALNMRVSAFLYLYLHLVEGQPEEQARELMDSIWDPADYPAWDTLIRAALARAGRPPA